ncbi:hypothetical protein AKG11_28335 [Shinella sp. SUS2]|uniref:hypothetical protein n=1 Tax=unclassified Shinella TaxID=2643062 RepID=UPI000680AC6E|nr:MULTISPECIES: hypothetical protein [unclassified Shinella]KNY13644.1 hypothetical protein AKG11_28335 [Shinella sp. SUS2]KOC72537.1 hypothetical protein AKG10_27200 [Shinella sp. GWS1]
MDLDTYEDWAREECLFIGSLMEKEGVMTILASCLHLGEEEIRERGRYHQDVVDDFFHTPRSKRAKLLAGIDDKEYLHAVLVLLLHEARRALLLLETLCKYGVSAGANPSKSRMIEQAAAALSVASAEYPPLYPFAEDLPFGMSLEWFAPPALRKGGQGAQASPRVSTARNRGATKPKPQRDQPKRPRTQDHSDDE